MDPTAALVFARDTIEPFPLGDADVGFRCAGYLHDGVYLPCILLRNVQRRIDQAKTAIARAHRDSSGGTLGTTYDDAIRRIVATGNRVSVTDIERLELSPFALPTAMIAEVKGETAMSLTQFVGVMGDGSEHAFRTSWSTAFFEMPEGYSAKDVVRIVPHKALEGRLYRARPHFECFLDEL